MTTTELENYLIEEAEYSAWAVDGMTDYEKFDAWLRYNGMIGWTSEILDVLKGCPNLLEETITESMEEE